MLETRGFSEVPFLKSEMSQDITIFDSANEAGCGMPYRPSVNANYMYCNAFSKEIPPVTRRLVTWLHDQKESFLRAWGLERGDIDAWDFYPRVALLHKSSDGVHCMNPA